MKLLLMSVRPLPASLRSPLRPAVIAFAKRSRKRHSILTADTKIVVIIAPPIISPRYREPRRSMGLDAGQPSAIGSDRKRPDDRRSLEATAHERR